MNKKPTYIIDRLDSLIELYQEQVEAFEKELNIGGRYLSEQGTREHIITYKALYNKAQGALVELKRIRDEILTGRVVLYK